MRSLLFLISRIDVHLTNFLARFGILITRLGLGFVFLWFGILKFFPGVSPSQDLVVRTVAKLTFGIVPTGLAMLILAGWECAIGLGLITGLFLRVTLLMLFVQMLGTTLPIFFFPSEIFSVFPYVPTLEGQYIIKNFVLIGMAMIIGATVRGGKLVADPEAARDAELSARRRSSRLTPRLGSRR